VAAVLDAGSEKAKVGAETTAQLVLILAERPPEPGGSSADYLSGSEASQ
jgi:hypothetical protein